MLNKKLGLLVMSAAMLGLVACGGNNDQKSSEQTTTQEAQTSQQQGGTSQAASQGDTPSIPEVAGKIALYFEFQDTETVKLAELPTYVSPFITGNWNGYNQRVAGGAVELIRLNDTRVFYGYIPGDSAMGDNGYQITLGYNDKSGLAADKQGVDWNFKTNYSAKNFAGLDHPFLTKVNDTLYVASNADHPNNPMGFDDCPPEPVVIKNITATFTLDASLKLGSNLEIVAKGDYNGWATEAVAEKDGVYTITLGDETDGIIAGDVQLCIGVRNKLVGGDMQDRYNLAIKDRKKASGGVEEAVKDDKEVVTKYEVSNIVVGLIAAYGDGRNYEIGSLAAPVHASGTLEDYELPSNDAPKMPHSVVIRLENTPANAEPETDGKKMSEVPSTPAIEPYFVGALTEWKHIKMEVVEAGRVWEYVIYAEEMFVSVETQFKFSCGAWDLTEVAPVDETGKVNGNFSITPTVGVVGYTVKADLSTWDATKANNKIAGVVTEMEELTLPDTYTATIRVLNLDKTSPSKVALAGELTDWNKHAEMEKISSDDGEWYCLDVNLGGMKSGATKKIKLTDGTWDNNIGGHADGDGNYGFVVSYGETNYAFAAHLGTWTGEIGLYVVPAVVE